MKIFSIFNKSASYYNIPMYFESIEACIDNIQKTVASDYSKALFNMASSLELHYIGDIDFKTFEINKFDAPVNLGNIFDDFCGDIKFKEVIIKDADE